MAQIIINCYPETKRRFKAIGKELNKRGEYTLIALLNSYENK